MKRNTELNPAVALFLLVAITFLLGPVLPGASAKQKPYNILFIISDDLTATALSCYGNKVCKTPNIDKLASQGMRFTRCYTPSSICSPNRGVLLSGQYPLKNGVHANHSGYFDGISSKKLLIEPQRLVDATVDALAEGDRAFVDGVLEGTGLEALFT